ncbi:MAG: zeta toxin family protein [Puniceicoccales bacterium]|jgi:hypothetical protein|nr:zeta toxin family protein [Puniceicoccales bacterium]
MEQALLDFIEQQYGNVEIAQKFPVGSISALAEVAFQEMVAKLPRQCVCPFCMRLVGQSGSGKTTQLLPAVEYVFQQANLSPVFLAVRNFVPYHPHLEAIKQQYGEHLLRENTNAFALSMLVLVFEKCVQRRYPVVFEVTLQSPLFEAHIHALLEENAYACDYQCLAIAKKDSDAWIQARYLETRRHVSHKSAQFFFETLNPALKFLQTIHLPNRFFIWNRYRLDPDVSSCQDPFLLEKVERARLADDQPALEESVLREAKKQFLSRFYEQNPITCRSNF